jgi:hypothetical protein
MAKDDKKAKGSTAPTAEVTAKKKDEATPKDKTAPGTEPAKAKSGDTAAAAPKNYSRGEGQKPVTQAYKDNWNAIFGRKKKKRKKR